MAYKKTGRPRGRPKGSKTKPKEERPKPVRKAQAPTPRQAASAAENSGLPAVPEWLSEWYGKHGFLRPGNVFHILERTMCLLLTRGIGELKGWIHTQGTAELRRFVQDRYPNLKKSARRSFLLGELTEATTLLPPPVWAKDHIERMCLVMDVLETLREARGIDNASEIQTATTSNGSLQQPQDQAEGQEEVSPGEGGQEVRPKELTTEVLSMMAQS
jgi:hypothetical protein